MEKAIEGNSKRFENLDSQLIQTNDSITSLESSMLAKFSSLDTLIRLFASSQVSAVLPSPMSANQSSLLAASASNSEVPQIPRENSSAIPPPFDRKQCSSISMEKQYEKKITWMIKNFSTLPSERIYSDQFVVGSSKWRLLAYYPKGDGDGINKCLSLFLDVADSDSLPDGWRRHANCRLTVVNQISEKLSQRNVFQTWFNKESPGLGYSEMLPLTKLLDQNSGFMVNGEVKIVAEVGVLEVIGKSDVLKETLLVNESMDVHGFQVLPSQVESVNSLFEKHPDIASEFCLENLHLRTAYLNSLLSLTEILSQFPEELAIDDLASAFCALTCLTKAGFKLDWLEKKLKEAGETQLQEIEKDLKQNCKDRNALLKLLR